MLRNSVRNSVLRTLCNIEEVMKTEKNESKKKMKTSPIMKVKKNVNISGII